MKTDPRKEKFEQQAREVVFSAFWTVVRVESLNSMLGCRRPCEVLASDPVAVLAATRDQVRGPVHG